MTILRWKPTIIEDTMTIPMTDPPRFIRMMEDAGLPLPCSVSDDDLPILRGMAAAAADPSTIKEIINLIIAHNNIDLILSD